MKKDNFFLANLGQFLGHFRLINKFSQEQFAFLCKIDRAYLAKIEKGKANLSIFTLKKIADILRMKLAVVFKEIEKKEKNKYF